MDAHLPLEALNDFLETAKRQVLIGGKYVHYKGGAYTVIGMAILEATDEVMVVYRSETDQRITFVRPLTIWLETVEHHGKKVPRFKQVEAQ